MVLVAVIPTAPVRALVECTRHSPGSNAAGNASVVLYARPRRSRNHIMTAGEVCRGVRCRIMGPYRPPPRPHGVSIKNARQYPARSMG